MKLYLDSADPDEWAKLLPSQMFYGITTNPLLAARAGLHYDRIDWQDLIEQAQDLGALQFHAQVAGPFDGYFDWAADLYDIGTSLEMDVVVKIPLVPEAIATVPMIRSLGGKVLMTACYDAKQMFVAKALGADFIAPYFGRMLENDIDAYQHLAQMHAMETTRIPDDQSTCQILVASLRNTEQMCRLAAMGLSAFTISPALASDLLNDSLSHKALGEFEAAQPSL